MATFCLDCSIKAGELDTLDVAGVVAPERLTAQAEMVALVQAWDHDGPDPCQELAALRCIATNSLAVGMVAARGIDIAKRIATLENITASFSREMRIDADDTAFDATCGYDGPDVWLDDTDTVAEYC